MPRYEHFPIYKAALDLKVHLEKMVAGFSRIYKYTLGSEMRTDSRSMLLQVPKAISAPNATHRHDVLLDLRDMINALLLTMRVVKKIKAFKGFTGCR